MKRTYLVPVLSTVAALGSACGSSIEGNWQLTSATYEGTVATFPYMFSETYDGITYTYTSSIDMIISGDNTARLSQTYSYAVDGQPEQTETSSYDGTWDKGENKTFDIGFSEIELNMNCTLEDEELECDDSNGSTFVFGPADE